MIYELKIYASYPNNYWFKFKNNQFSLKSKVSLKKLFSFDVFFSDGPAFISPRLASLIDETNSDVQLIEVNVSVNGVNYQGYKMVKIVRKVSAIDLEASESEPILSYLPDGPKKFRRIVFKEDVSEDFWIARCQEYPSCIIVSDQSRNFLLTNDVIGIELKDIK
ncbi:imm11 family protein [Xylocopilactobacillus apis]|uniref:Immunity MXAN-0049 protein domain-containing protein n=1 Tax=Xylocopilactobacillus apis TaxID=2932183 RepID=A0AAU9D2Z9_9LACO|nr:DUF1629 domain-containing protein [Xylocopilactobacillus apis]BDR55765.1 hypothetical protein KIMC2_03270 [Xylocopilactobacillus apis]